MRGFQIIFAGMLVLALFVGVTAAEAGISNNKFTLYSQSVQSASAEDNVTLTRQGSNVNVEISGSVFSRNVTNGSESLTVQLSIRDADQPTDVEITRGAGNQYTGTIDITRLVSGSDQRQNLRATTVQIAYQNESIGNATVDLRWVVLEEGGSHFDESTLVVPARTVIGIPEGNAIEFDYGTSVVEGTVSYSDGSAEILLDLANANRDTLLARSSELQPRNSTISGGSITIFTPELASRATQLRYSGGSPVISNPLFSLLPSDTQYAIRVYDPAGEPIYGSLERAQNGHLPLPRPVVDQEMEVAIWTAESNRQILSRDAAGQPYSLTRESVTANLTNGTLRIQGDRDWSVTKLLYRDTDGAVRVLDVSQSGGANQIENATTLSEIRQVFLITDDGRVLNASLTGAQDIDGQNGTAGPEDETTGDRLSHLAPIVAIIALSMLIGGSVAYALELLPIRSGHLPRIGVFVFLLIVVVAASAVVYIYELPSNNFSIITERIIEMGMLSIFFSWIAAFLFFLTTDRKPSLVPGISTTSSKPVEKPPTTEFDIVITDENGNRLTSEVQVKAIEVDATGIPIRGGETRQKTTNRGSTTLTLPPKTFKISAQVGDQNNSKVVNVGEVGSNPKMSVVLRRPELNFIVTKADSQIAISDATITVKTEEELEHSTDNKGRRKIAIPYTSNEVEVVVNANRYEPERQLVSVSGDKIKVPVELEPKTGDLHVSTTIDGQPTSGLSVRIIPLDGRRRQDRRVEGVSDSRGHFTARDLLIGEYRVELTIDDERFTTPTDRIRIEKGVTTNVSLDARFKWRLSQEHRRRVEDLRAQLVSLSDGSNRDVAIPRYFGSVVNETLNAVESLPDAGHLFASAPLGPDDMTEALLQAAAAAIDRVEQAMSTKTNMDLFVACADLPDTDVKWEGEISIPDLFEWTDRGTADLRNTLARRLDTVNDHIERERQNVAEIAPVEAMWEETRGLLRQAGQMDPIPQTITMYVTKALLDAIEQIFEHDSLTERMDKTVF